MRDMEELVLSIKNEYIREYMEEARNCYNTKSYRACIILSTIAAMHDLREKIKALASSVKDAKTLDDEIENRIKKEINYENYMIEQATSIGILSTPETESIKSYTNLRNRCAHPNEYIATAEEARMVFTGFYDNIISKPGLLGPAYIKVIRERLKNEKLFPDYNIHSIKMVAEEEFRKMHPNTVVPLANNLISVLSDTSLYDTVEWKNANSLLTGILSIIENEEQIRRISQGLSRLLETEALFNSIIVISRNFPEIVSFFTLTDRQRYIAHLKSSINNSIHEIKIEILSLLFTKGILSSTETTEVVDIFVKQISKSINVISGSTDRSSVEELEKWVKITQNINILQIDVSFFDTLIKLLGDNDYNIVNATIILLKSLNNEFLKRMNDKQLADIVILVIKQAHGAGRGADKARELLESNFKELPLLIEHFIQYVTNDYAQYSYYNNKITFSEDFLIDILHENKNFSKITTIIDFIKEEFSTNLDLLEPELAYLSKLIKKKNVPEWNHISFEIDNYLKELIEEIK